ncbi:hypothetical protein SmJEL517_g05642 [Synchytrium microbalum]|uniref:Protein-serine/threonine kinase n=1 Tax=Synchytrium microbalum TaxID=1806994 RepID=A0A507BZY0_9FUNG|nr:uncharacterized protein SmJEL517_g05642 [Synchytrium microbalum]TPX30895.1 hypothetical protein SmJEL517_g05642 [Synchytrium microbalum]
MGSKFPVTLLDKIKQYATHAQTPVSLKQMVEFGRVPSQATLLSATRFAHHELPIRLAYRVVELESLPHSLSEMPSVIKVKDWYTQSFNELIEFPKPEDYGVPRSAIVQKTGPVKYYNDAVNQPPSPPPPELVAYNNEFSKTLENIKRRHDPVVTTLAQGIQEVKDHWNRQSSPLTSDVTGVPLPSAVQQFLDRFYLSRIGIRMLIGQHVSLAKSAIDPRSTPPDHVGIICTKTNLRKVAQEAADNARFICQEYYGLWGGPEIKLLSSEDIEFMYVPSHLHHMLFELLKNSLRAVVERFGEDADSYPEIRVVVAAGKEDITIKVSDEGGGIPRRGMPLIWTYLYTTASTPMLEEGYNKSDFKAPLAGFGYGLPLSRLYARYFGGDLRLISMEGYGTDAYLHLSRLSDSEEPLQ